MQSGPCFFLEGILIDREGFDSTSRSRKGPAKSKDAPVLLWVGVCLQARYLLYMGTYPGRYVYVYG